VTAPLPNTCAPLAGNDRTFRHTAREFLVLAAWRAGDAAAAKRAIAPMIAKIYSVVGANAKAMSKTSVER
jgi:hypothetical protein